MKEEQILYSRGESEDYTCRPEKVKIELKKLHGTERSNAVVFTLISSSEFPSYMPGP